jgi:hypothetical protein
MELQTNTSALREQTPPELRFSDTEVDDYDFEEYEYDLPTEHGIVVSLLLLPFDLLMAILSCLVDVLQLIPYFFRCLGELRRDLIHAGEFYGDQLRVTLNQWIIGPLYFAVSDPIGCFLHVIDRTIYLAWTIRWGMKLLWDGIWEQIDDVGRLLELVWVQALEVFNLVEPAPSPIHAAVPRRPPMPLPIASDAYLRTRPASRNRTAPSFVLMRTSQENATIRSQPAAPLAHPVFKPSSRTRLAPENAQVDPDEIADETNLRSAHKTKSGNVSGFYQKCPSCASEEIYAVKPNGQFAKSPADFGLVVQHMFCERCITPFRRPGRLFLAPTPVIRPADTDLYDH